MDFFTIKLSDFFDVCSLIYHGGTEFIEFTEFFDERSLFLLAKYLF